MPVSRVDLGRLRSLLGEELSEPTLREVLFRSKVEPGAIEGSELILEVTPDRLDLLDEAGLARELNGLLGRARGLDYATEPAPVAGAEGRQNASVSPLRGEFQAAVVVAPADRPLDEGLREELVRYQELLHSTTGQDRRAGSLGLYPLERLTPPIRYALEPLGQIEFVPLGGTEPMSAARFFDEHPMAQRYGALGRQGELALTLRDSQDRILSLPPVLNATPGGEIRPGDRRILIESTGTNAARVRELVGYMLLPFAGRGWKVHPFPIHRPERVDDGLETIRSRSLSAVPTSLARTLGTRFSASELVDLFHTLRLGAEPKEGKVRVEVPPWRPDLLAECDLAEEVAIAQGYNRLAPLLAPALTQGRRLPPAHLEDQLREVAMGMGFQELYVPTLVSAGAAARGPGLGESLPLVNPPSQEYSHVRSSLAPGLLEALSRNTGSPYPQRVFEVGAVVVPDRTSPTRTRTERRLALLEAAEGTGFAQAAAWGERLLTLLGVQASREPLEVPGTLPGRSAQVRLAGERLFWLGEVHPRVLTELKLPCAVSFLELDLTTLERLRPSPLPA